MGQKKIIWGTILAVCVIGLSAVAVVKANASISVSVTKVATGTISDKVFASGHLEATNVNTYFAPQSGVVASLKVKLGDKVKKGQVLFVMDTTDLQQQLEMEQNNLKIAQNDRDDANKQNNQSSSNPLVPKQTIDINSLDLKVESEQKTIDHLQQKINASQVIAQSDGVITDLQVKEGQAVGQGSPVLTVTNLSSMQVRANLNELDSNQVQTGEAAQVTGDGFSGTYDGKVTYLSPVAAPASPTSKDPVVEMVVILNKTADELRPGYSASVEIDLPADSHLLAPLSAVKHDGDQSYVYKVTDQNQAQRVNVKTGKEDDSNVEILSGLQAGVKIVNNVPDTLSDGKKVSVQ